MPTDDTRSPTERVRDSITAKLGAYGHTYDGDGGQPNGGPDPEADTPIPSGLVEPDHFTKDPAEADGETAAGKVETVVGLISDVVANAARRGGER